MTSSSTALMANPLLILLDSRANLNQRVARPNKNPSSPTTFSGISSIVDALNCVPVRSWCDPEIVSERSLPGRGARAYSGPFMAQPKRHHHVPELLLSGWCRDDGRLAVYSNRGRRVVVDWHTPEHTAFESNLYEIAALPKEDRQWVERELMSKAVDDKVFRSIEAK